MEKKIAIAQTKYVMALMRMRPRDTWTEYDHWEYKRLEEVVLRLEGN
jgi:hypothetical protein